MIYQLIDGTDTYEVDDLKSLEQQDAKTRDILSERMQNERAEFDNAIAFICNGRVLVTEKFE